MISPLWKDKQYEFAFLTFYVHMWSAGCADHGRVRVLTLWTISRYFPSDSLIRDTYRHWENVLFCLLYISLPELRPRPKFFFISLTAPWGVWSMDPILNHETKVPTPEKPISDEDQLAALGHVQELRRDFSLWSIVCLQISLMATWEALSSVVAAALTNGGAPCLFYN